MPFSALCVCVQHVRLNALGQLREKSRIFLEHSGFLFGVLDELGVLGENQVWRGRGMQEGGAAADEAAGGDWGASVGCWVRTR